jgi:hypothetical protein
VRFHEQGRGDARFPQANYECALSVEFHEELLLNFDC